MSERRELHIQRDDGTWAVIPPDRRGGMTTAEEIAWAIIEMADNTQSSHEEIRKLVAGQAVGRWPRDEQPPLWDCQEIGEEIKGYIEESFPGSLLARLLSMADWATVGKHYLDDYIESRTGEK